MIPTRSLFAAVGLLVIGVVLAASVLPEARAAEEPGRVTPPALAGNVAWWVADDRAAEMTLVDVTTPGDPRLWSDPQKGFTITPGQPDPAGGNGAYRVMENAGVGHRWLACEPPGYITGPCTLTFHYKPINGASVWEADGSTFYPEFEFNASGVGRVGKHPYAIADNSWFSVAPAPNGFHKVDLWFHGATHVRKAVTLSTVSNGAKPTPGDASKGFLLHGLTFSQTYVTALKDRSPAGAHLAGAPADAPFLQRSAQPAGLLTGGSCLWQPEEACKFLSTTHQAARAALSGTAPHTVLALVRRQWCRGEPTAAAKVMHAVASAGGDYAVGFTRGGNTGAVSLLFAGGADGAGGPTARTPSDTEWNVIAVINTGPSASIYLLDGPEPRLLAGPTPVTRGTIAEVRLCAQRSAVRELAIWDSALDLGAAQAQAHAMVARAGGAGVLATFKTFDGLTIQTQTKAAPYHWRDDSGVAFYKNACWILAGAIETVTNSNDVWKSTDRGVTWTEVKQQAPFAPSQGAAAFTMTVNGTEYLYCVGCYENRGGDQTIYRSTDGSNWARVCEAPPWKNNFGMAIGLLGKDLFVMGGQTKGRTPASAVSHVYKSSDGGATWTQLPDAPWRPRMAFGPLLPAWKGKLWVVHGGTYGQGAERFDDIWAFDGKTWARVLEHTPWPASLWSTAFVLDDELFVMSGSAGDGEHRILWRSSDGVNWRASFPLPWGPAHESCATTTDQGVLLAPTDWNQTTRLLTTRPAAGPRR